MCPARVAGHPPSGAWDRMGLRLRAHPPLSRRRSRAPQSRRTPARGRCRTRCAPGSAQRRWSLPWDRHGRAGRGLERWRERREDTAATGTWLPPRRYASVALASLEYRPPDAPREQVIDEEVNKHEHPDIRSWLRVHGNLGGSAHLDVLADPDDARVHGPGRPSHARCVETRSQGDLYQCDESVQRRAEPDVLHGGLQVHEAVLHRESPVQGGGVHDASPRTLRRETRADDSRDRERTQDPERLRQVTEPLPEEEHRRDRRERFRADARRAGAADLVREAD